MHSDLCFSRSSEIVKNGITDDSGKASSNSSELWTGLNILAEDEVSSHFQP